ncbi:MAG: hypothetical protein E7497_02540 [Ruminococcus sp.]|nr:hypothetical protein [Ruminococcus sp.]
MKQVHYTMLYLVSCAVNGSIPEQKHTENIDMDALFSFSRAHFLEVLTGTSLKQSGIELSKEWTQKLSKSTRKNILFDNERKKLFDFMEQAGIWYLPLKGVILKEYYPAVGMRQMSDNDILFDEAFSEDVRNYMESQGYVGESIGKGAHDVYVKEPVYNFEFHRALFDSERQSRLSDYYADVKKRLLPNDSSSYGYHFTNEDFYIYIVAHAFKHYSGGGTGIRSLLDFYVYLTAEEQNMDFEYIQKECGYLGFSEFERQSRILCKKVFGADVPVGFEQFTNSLSEEEYEMLEYYLSSGVYGTTERFIKNRVNKFRKENGISSKLHYIFRRLFPGIETYKSYYPFFYKHKWLLPIGWLYRLVRMVFSKKRRSSVSKEMDIVRKM